MLRWFAAQGVIRYGSDLFQRLVGAGPHTADWRAGLCVVGVHVAGVRQADAGEDERL